MSLTEEPYYMKRDCSPMCDHQQECSRCGTPKCIKYMHHSRLHGYACSCGSQEWKPVMKFYSQGSGLTQLAADGETCPDATHNFIRYWHSNFKFCPHCGIRFPAAKA